MTTDADLLNALTTQNNQIATMIDRAEDGVELDRAWMQITFVADVWTALGYGYKMVELRKRVSRRAALLANQEREYIAACRKNDRTLVSSRRNLAKLEELCV